MAAAKLEYSREELGAILKFGASAIFKNDADQAKLEALNLDEVINQAEAFETATAPTGTSLGGEDFLQQFAAVQDIKADPTAWEDIIPAEDRERAAKEAEAERELASSRRATALLNDGPQDEGSAPSSPKAEKASKKSVAPRKTVQQRAMTLKDRDLRVLIRSLQRFGDIRHRYDAIVQDAKLEGKNRSIIIAACDELIRECRKALEGHREGAKLKEPTAEKSEKPKAVLLTFRGLTGVNVETTLSRVDELHLLHERKYLTDSTLC